MRPAEIEIGSRMALLLSLQSGCTLEPLPGSVGALAKRMHVDRRTISRRFLQAGLPSPSRVIRALRVAYTLIAWRDGVRTADLAARLGWADWSHFSRACRTALGVSPRVARDTMTPYSALMVALGKRELS